MNTATDAAERILRLQHMICFNFYSGWRFIRAYYRDCFPPGMSSQRFYVVGLCERDQGLNVSSVAHALQIDLPAVSALLSRMEKDGLVVRRPSPHNRREVLVFLTEEGHEVRERTFSRMGPAQEALMQYICEDDIEELKELVGRVRALVEAKTNGSSRR